MVARRACECWAREPDAVHASLYDTKEDAAAVEEAVLCQELGVTNECVGVEMGAGTGQFTLAIAPRCARVIAVDVSPMMLEVLREKCARGAVANVEVVQAGFLTYQHESPPADRRSPPVA